jgi:hypothetical protein
MALPLRLIFEQLDQATTTDKYQRRILLRLVAEEEAKGAAASRLVIKTEPNDS